MSSWLYFFISYPRKKRENTEDIIFVKPEDDNEKPQCIYVEDNYQNQIYFYMKIFKVKKTKKKDKQYCFEFEIDDEKYIITFESKNATFIYDVVLESGKRIINIKRKINQNNVEYSEKMKIFIEALKNNEEENKLDDLLKETIAIYSKKKGFGFLISIFLEIYETKKDLCSELLEIFKDMNSNKKDNEKNMDRKKYLDKYKSKFEGIINEADQLINSNKYNRIQFYGIILCYLNFYDHKNFSSIINELYNKTPNDLYEVLLIYHAHLENPIEQDSNFYNEFIKYTISNKEFSIFEIALKYIKDIETFINVIEINKNEIYDNYVKQDKSHKNIIKLDNNLKINKKIEKTKDVGGGEKIPDKPEKTNVSISVEINNPKVNDLKIKNVKDFKTSNDSKIKNRKENKIIFTIIKNIKSIITFSTKNKIFFIYFTENFWRYIINAYNEPKQDNILICYELRNIFMRYYELVMEVYKEKSN